MSDEKPQALRYVLSDTRPTVTRSMIHRQSVLYQGVEYLLLYRYCRQPAKSSAWVDAMRIEAVDRDLVPKLRDSYLAQSAEKFGRPSDLDELRRLYEVLLAMGATRDRILGRFGTHEPRRCVDCRQMTIDGYSGPRCEPCYEHFVRTARVRNAGLHDVSGGRMSGARRG